MRRPRAASGYGGGEWRIGLGDRSERSECRYRKEASGRCSAHLEAVDGEETAEDALLEPRAQNDHVVLLIHGWLPGEAAATAAKRR